MVDETPEADKNDPAETPLPDAAPLPDPTPLSDAAPDDGDPDPLPDPTPDDGEPSCRSEPEVPLEPKETSINDRNDRIVVSPKPKLTPDEAVRDYISKLKKRAQDALTGNKYKPRGLRLHALIGVLKWPTQHPPTAVHGVRHDHPAVRLGVVLTQLKAALVQRKATRPDGKEEEWGDWHPERREAALKRLRGFAEDYGSRPPPGLPGEPTTELHREAVLDSAVGHIGNELLRLIGDDELQSGVPAVPEPPVDGMTAATATWPSIPSDTSRG